MSAATAGTPVPSHFHAIRDAYDQTLTHLARLATLSAAVVPSDQTAIRARQVDLAITDLVNFSIHARRLLELVGLEANAKSHSLLGPNAARSYETHKETRCSFWRLLGYTIHCRQISLVQRHIDGPGDPFWSEHAIHSRNATLDHFIVRSDQSEALWVSLKSLVLTFEELLLPAVTEQMLALRD